MKQKHSKHSVFANKRRAHPDSPGFLQHNFDVRCFHPKSQSAKEIKRRMCDEAAFQGKGFEELHKGTVPVSICFKCRGSDSRKCFLVILEPSIS